MKTLKKTLLAAMLLFIACALYAQFPCKKLQDVVYLKNGSVIRGTITELVPDHSIRIKTADGNIFVFKMDEVEKYARERESCTSPSLKPDNSGVKRGYYGVIEAGTGVSFESMQGPLTGRFNLINGYRFSPYFAAGAGYGLRLYPLRMIATPIFADLRIHLVDFRTSPYMSLDAGYTIPYHENTDGGLFLSPTLGVTTRLGKRSSINIGINYEYQEFRYHNKYDFYFTGCVNEDYSLKTHTVSFQLGFSF